MKSDANAPLISFGPRVRKSPYFDATLRDGAKTFSVYNHTYLPTGNTASNCGSASWKPEGVRKDKR